MDEEVKKTFKFLLLISDVTPDKIYFEFDAFRLGIQDEKLRAQVVHEFGKDGWHGSALKVVKRTDGKKYRTICMHLNERGKLLTASWVLGSMYEEWGV